MKHELMLLPKTPSAVAVVKDLNSLMLILILFTRSESCFDESEDQRSVHEVITFKPSHLSGTWCVMNDFIPTVQYILYIII